MGHKRSVLKIDHFDRDSNSKIKNGSKYANGQLQKEAVGRGHLLNRKRGKASGKKVSQENAEWEVLRVRVI